MPSRPYVTKVSVPIYTKSKMFSEGVEPSLSVDLTLLEGLVWELENCVSAVCR